MSSRSFNSADLGHVDWPNLLPERDK